MSTATICFSMIFTYTVYVYGFTPEKSHVYLVSLSCVTRILKNQCLWTFMNHDIQSSVLFIRFHAFMIITSTAFYPCIENSLFPRSAHKFKHKTSSSRGSHEKVLKVKLDTSSAKKLLEGVLPLSAPSKLQNWKHNGMRTLNVGTKASSFKLQSADWRHSWIRSGRSLR